MKIFGRYNQFQTFTKWDDFTGGALAQPVDGSKRHSKSVSADMVYTLNATTVLNIRGAYNAIVDSFGVPEATLTGSGSREVLDGKPLVQALSGGPAGHLLSRRDGASRVDHNTRKNRVLVPGAEVVEHRVEDVEKPRTALRQGWWRVSSGSCEAARPKPMSFDFRPDLTAETYNRPDTVHNGDAWARSCSGFSMRNSTISSIPIQRPRDELRRPVPP